MASTITDGQTYVFFNWTNLKVIDLTGGGHNNNTPVITWQPHLDNGPSNQVWKASKVDGGFFVLTNVMSGTVLDLSGGGGAGTIIEGWQSNSGPNQSWSFEVASQSNEAPSFYIKNKSAGTYITVPNGNSDPGVQLQGLLIGKGQKSDWSRWVAVPFKI